MHIASLEKEVWRPSNILSPMQTTLKIEIWLFGSVDRDGVRCQTLFVIRFKFSV
jgi:hypothetical protein